ncbi:S1-like domain-containing RNA-binding protein [Reichenbachiella agarivorans]|uniref:S1-like domain-containing RNA-binding protein n=1 Tax=Reichenbachiella agarivorans TaxID=2979464 RepID=A0ABY6CLU3_9BACT|nr:S1-like domain-containing RNA-binding protein [Reichenbachiella agarivorans]UXP31490.1 S1-like domain-containing RNA-binding protein [Reichenbachiella agarivorans]
MEIGDYNPLRINRFTDNGAYLIDEAAEEVLLPNKYVAKDFAIGDVVDVFVYTDSMDRNVATTLKPLVKRGEFACLEVKDVSAHGAFMDWGLEKDLFVPFSEQEIKMKKGQWALVYAYLDSITKRVAASARIHLFINRDLSMLEEGQEVDLIIGETTINGIRAIIDQKHLGLIYENEVFEELLKGSHKKGFIKTIRPDGKIDLSLRKPGLEALEEGAEKIMQTLRAQGGKLPLHDKSSPEDIQAVLQMSKKNFKRSVGILYKQKLIELKGEEIILIDNSSS